MNRAKASVIIATYHRPDTVRASVESCLAQDYGNLEIIVVDDNGQGSDFQIETRKVLSDLIDEKRIVYLANEKNSRVSQTRNNGINAASGKYILFLDDDDIFLPRKVSYQVSFLEQNPGYDGHAVGYQIMRNRGKTKADSIPVIGDFQHFAINGNSYTPMLCIKKEAIISVGGFKNVPQNEDYFLVLELLEANYKVYADERPLYLFNEQPHARVTLQDFEKTETMVAFFRAYLEKHRNRFTDENWNKAQARFITMTALRYYYEAYGYRIKTIPSWWKCYRMTGDRFYLKMIIKSITPEGLNNKIVSILKKINYRDA
ncbi:glycosyltransferase involved in cell wall biosynthesis [Dysgonomonas sp. PH5-45]|uniref:glycosyltransferase n=1 Tax=unclassified Dysgonomonas TaxID=2630389 RepID=UPI002476D99B|nr:MULTISPECIES: glycosyltransferase family A protein [unclassified Dysgonomonas]MDH6354845.1 glycosyltransferase involved in cell wall biosynthesis [Dysgonomonas sp. PH5-45]MDH6387744.1 glycosyltransferase involved in cell wall biosynthesis [Dysgonomonas sp. PH5-37]